MKTGVDGLEGQRPRLTHFSATAVRNRFQTQLQGIDHNRKGGAFEIEQPKVGPKGEPSGNERIKGHREHGVDNEVLQQMEVALKQVKVFVSA
jgi:hypothetical protein